MIARLTAFLLLSLIAVTPNTALAQYGPFWEKIGQIEPSPSGNIQSVRCGYFWSRDSGVVGVAQKTSSSQEGTLARIYYRHGGSWLLASHPNIDGGVIRQITMVDRKIGYAVLERDQGKPAPTALITNDGGMTWSIFIDQAEEANDVVILPNGEMRYAFGGFGTSLTSFTRYGIQGESIALGPGILCTIDEYSLRYSYDNGLNWSIRPTQVVPDTVLYGEAGIHYSEKFNTLVVSPFGGGAMNGPLVSTDNGRTFQYIKDWGGAVNKEWQGTTDLCGGRDAMYSQSSTTQIRSNGIIRSLNGGYDWKLVGGPGNGAETRFFVLGCTGSKVIAFDTLGGIWYSETGGDGTMARETYTHPIFSNPGSISSSLCGDSLISIPYLNDLCDKFRVDSIAWVVSDPSLDPGLYSSGALNLIHSQLPRTYSTDQTDSILVTWDPKLFFEHDTTFSRKIFIRYYSGTDGKMHDTTLSIALTAKANAPRITLDKNVLDFLNTSTCFTLDTTITITNTGCDTLTLDNVKSTGSAFSYSGISVPKRLAPGESATVTLTFHPSTQGMHNGSLEVLATQQGITRKTDIQLSGTGTFGEGLLELLTASDVKLPEMSICAQGDDTLAMIRNTGCDTIIVKNVAVTGSSDYTLASTLQNVVLPPDSTLTFRIIFTPQDKGNRSGLVTIAWSDEKGANSKDITIKIGANVIDGNKVLSTEGIAAINLGETNICEERDSLVHLINKGCDTLTITSADVDKHFDVGGNFPIKLAPGESIDVPITTIVDTIGKPTVLTGLLNITSTADNQIAPITLTRSLYYPTKLRIEAVDEASGKEGDVVKFRVLLEGQVPSTMTALKFDFLHNNDLLSWDGYDGVGLNRTNVSGNENERASFVLSPVHAGVIGELTFKTRLALAEQTTLSFDNITFEAKGVSFAPECIAVISDTGTRFNYIYTCGDNIIRDRLNGTRLIKSITPNPAKDEIRIQLNVSGSADVSVFNALGVKVVKSAGERVDVSKLPSGVYYVRIAVAGSVETRRMVISR